VEILFESKVVSGKTPAEPLDLYIGSPHISSRPQKKKHRNVLLVSLDTLRADRLGCYGYEFPTSPVIDELAGDSILFENAEAQSTWTLPSHMSLFTSLHLSEHRMDEFEEALAEPILTFPHVLEAAGVQNAAFTGGGWVFSSFGYERGFDVYHNCVAPEWPQTREHGEPLTVIGGRALDWLKRHGRDAPFFLFVHTFDIHGDYIPSRETVQKVHPGHSYSGRIPEIDRRVQDVFLRDVWMARLAGKPSPVDLTPEDAEHISFMYDGNIRRADDMLGWFFEELRALGFWDDLLVILLSDHGEELGDHGLWYHGHTVHRELTHVPLIIRFPKGDQRRGGTIRTPIALNDVAPTILDYLDVEIPDQFRGHSLLPLIEGGKPGPVAVYSETEKTESISRMSERYKVIAYHGEPETPAELYDWRKDPMEQESLSSLEADRAEAEKESVLEFHTRMRNWRPDLTPSGFSASPEVERQLAAWGYLDSPNRRRR